MKTKMNFKISLFIVVVFISINAFSQSYNAQNIADLKAFLSQSSAIQSKSNASVLGITDLDNPSTWQGYSTDLNSGGFVWSVVNNEYVLARLNIGSFSNDVRNKIAGELVLDDSKKQLKSIDITGTKITKLQLTGATNALYTVFARNCPELQLIDLSTKTSGYSNLIVSGCAKLTTVLLHKNAGVLKSINIQLANIPLLATLSSFDIKAEKSNVSIDKCPIRPSQMPIVESADNSLLIKSKVPFFISEYYNTTKKYHEVSADDIIDLSAEKIINDVTSEISWVDEKDKVVKPDEVEPGKFRLKGKGIKKNGMYTVKIKNSIFESNFYGGVGEFSSMPFFCK
jgi:hypothetical protein